MRIATVTGKTVGGTQLAFTDNRLSREEALKLYTVGSAWFSGEETLKGRITPGRYADFAVLSADYFAVLEEEIKRIESVRRRRCCVWRQRFRFFNVAIAAD